MKGTDSQTSILKKYTRTSIKFVALLCISFSVSLFVRAESINSHQYAAFQVVNKTSGISYVYFVAKESLLLLHGDVVIPIPFMPDLPTYYILNGLYTGYGDIVAPVYSQYTTNLNENTIDENFPSASYTVTRLTNIELFNGDFDGDGQSDLVISYGTRIDIFSDANNEISLISTTTPPGGYQILGTGNYGGDTKADLKISYQSQEYELINQGGGEFFAEKIISGVNTSLVGAAAGAFRVNEQGAATYSIPITSFAGTAGVAPEFSLQYSSQGGSGVAGQGWSLGGLSAITRCRQTESQDGQNLALAFNSGDRFCLDGQRLILTSGTYGSAGSSYRTEIDSYALIQALGGSAGHPSSFTVTRKDGSVSTYGDSTNTKHQVSQGTMTWAISEFQDSVGNPITYQYLNNSDGFYIQQVNYAFGSGSTSQAHISFEYEARPDVQTGYSLGEAVSSKVRLSRIDSHNEGVAKRSYRLSYLGLLPSANRAQLVEADKSYLQAVYECVGSDCFTPTEFNWQVTSGHTIAETTSDTFTFSSDDRPVSGWKPIDINGDSIGDLVWLNSGYYYNDLGQPSSVKNNFLYAMLGSRNGYQAPQVIYSNSEDNANPMHFQVLDYNGDGKQDVAIWDYGSWKILLSEAQGTGGWMLGNTASEIDTGIIDSEASFADINADGLVDVTYGTSSVAYMERNTAFAASSNKAYQFGAPQSIAIPEYDESDGGYPYYRNEICSDYGDFNGDGRMDIWVKHYQYDLSGITDGNWDHITTPLIYLTTRAYTVNSDNSATKIFTGNEVNNPATQSYDCEFGRVADINADGLSDSIWKGSSWIYRLSGRTEGEAVSIGNFHEKAPPQFVDYNRDGYLDLVWHDVANSLLKVRLWDAINEKFTSTEAIIRNTDGNENHGHFLMDLNGDGGLDYILTTGKKISIYKSTPVGIERTITRIDSGLGNQTNISYERLSNNSEHYIGMDKRVELENTTASGCWVGGCFNYPITTANVDEYYKTLNSDWSNDLNSVHNAYGLNPQYKSKTSPVLEWTAPVNIVTRVSSSAPVSGNANARSHISYYYSEAKAQAGGRGLLGFRSITTQDEQSQIWTSTLYRQDFPFIGSPLYTEVKTPNDVIIKKSFNYYGFVERSGLNNTKYYQVYARNVFDSTYDLNASETSYTVSYTGQPDSWGNILNTRVSTYSAASHINYLTQLDTQNQYTGNADDQQLGRLSHSTVTHRRAGVSDISKTSSFTYFTSGLHNNLLESETINSNGANTFAVSTRYEYDTWGNKSKATVSTTGETARTAQWLYTSDGRYLEKTTNNLGHVTQEILTRDSTGSPTQIRGLNNHYTDIIRDELGRETYRSDSTGAWQQTTYSRSGLISGAYYKIATEVSGGGSSAEYFDLLARSMAKSAIGFDGLVVWTKTEYDSSGRVKRQSIPYRMGESLLWATNHYDILGRINTQTLADGSTVNYQYTGLQTRITNALGQTKTETRNGAGELTNVEDAINGRITYNYTADGQLQNTAVIADGKTITTQLVYNHHGQKIKMFDPDKGTWFYQYNGFGELINQYKVTSIVNYTGTLESLTTSQYQRTHMIYDALGRMTQREDYQENNQLEGTSTWTYDTATNAIGKLHQESGGGLSKTYTYGAYSDTTRSDTVTYTGGIAATLSTTYDSIGRPTEQIDAVHLGSGTQNTYNNYGYLDTVIDIETQSIIYDVVDTDARGNVTEAILQDGVTQTREYNQATGRLTRLTAKTIVNASVQDLYYTWDDVGNMLSRNDQQNGQTQSFCYDALNRLTKTHSTLNGGCNLSESAQDIEYDGFGNIKRKTGVGNYTYSTNMALRPHAVTTAGGVTYNYDNNGNVIDDELGRTFTYSSFDKPTQITKDNKVIDFSYGANRARWKRVDTDTSTNEQSTTYYIANVEKVVNSTGTRFKRSIAGVAIWVHDNNGTLLEQKTLYKDALGSVAATRDVATGNLSQTAFNPWGERVAPTNLNDILDGTQLTSFLDLFNVATTRGFTGHEMLDAVGIIHMNGRIYDARLGRFLQADSFVDGVTNTQGFNRYSYVQNNPLNATDPTGNFSLRKWVGAIVAVVGSVICAPACTQLGFAIIGAASGAASAAANGGNILQGAIIGGISGAAFSGVAGAGSFFETTFGSLAGVAQFAAFGAVGGITSVLSGGKFGHGFIAAGVGGSLAGRIGGVGGANPGGAVIRTLIRTVVGGTISKLTGGKFANGAAFAAFASIVSEGASTLSRPGATPESKLPLSQRQAGAQTEISALTTDGTLNTGKVFTGENAVGDAATEVLNAVHPISEKYNLEIGGGIVESGDGYSYTTPFPGKNGSVNLSPNGIVAGYHTHPGGDYMSQLFSNQHNSRGPGDAGWSTTYGKPLYMSHSYGGGTSLRLCNGGYPTCHVDFNQNRRMSTYGVSGEAVK